jgi:acyl carrier protein
VLVCEERDFVGTVEQVIEVVADRLGKPVEEVKPESNFVEDLDADSLDLVELIMALEDEYDVTIPDEDAQNIRTIADAVAYIETHRD